MTSTSERIERLSPQKLALLKKAMSDSAGRSEPIAVVGIGCRFAGASSIDQYWRLIHDSRDMTGEIPSSRWDIDEFYDASGSTPGKMTTRWGGFLDNIDCFDAAFFGISPREAEKMDPQHRLLLEVTWEALEYGGLAPAAIRESATGVFIGVGGVDYSRVPVSMPEYFEMITAYSGTGNALSIAANRISYALDLRGPSLSIDTACSSSLVAAHLAVKSLRAKECDMAIVGGVNAILTPETTLAFSQAQMLSPDGKCRPFDDRANGYVRGEGCGVVVLKRLSDAVSNSDIVLATIRGSAVNQDGMTSGITAPRGTAQVAVIQSALRDAGREPQDVSYIEAHGTATPLGDPIEVNALAEVFCKRDEQADEAPCYFGSVKANVGHTETAAGMASLIKTVLMFRHQTIPGQAHFQSLNRHIDLSGSRLAVAEQLMPWNAGDKAPVAGISSFGFGGTNAHLVLEAATTSATPEAKSDRPRHVFTMSAKTPEGLQKLAARVSESIANQDDFRLADACYTAAVGRSHFNYRAAIPAGDVSELNRALQSVAEGAESTCVRRGKAAANRRPNVAFLFAGQGSQYPGMGRQLYRTHRVFREALEQCDEILASQLPRRLLEVLFEDPSSEAPLVNETQYTQPALFAIEYALSRLWRSFGIEPAVMIGHSIGDYVAACEAEVFSLQDGLTLVAHRARLVGELPHDGQMAVVFAERERVADLVMPYGQDVSVAVHNGPQNVVISGRSSVLGELLEQFELAGIKSRTLEVSHAMHSPLLDPILDEFEQRAGKVSFHDPKIPLVSSRDGQRIDGRIRTAAYWRDHLRNTVCFVDGIHALQAFSLDAAIEIGPGTTLCGLGSRAWNGQRIAWLPSMRPGRDDWDVLTETLSEMYVRGVNVDWQSFDQPWPRKRQVLPTYPFEAQSFWYDMSGRGTGHISRLPVATGSAHPLLGHRLPVAGDKTVFELALDSRHPRFLADHCIDQSPVVPAAAYMEQALAAAGAVFGEGNHTVSNLSIQQALVLSDTQRRVVQIQVGPDLRGQRSLEIHSRPASGDESDHDAWSLHASATLHQATAQSAPESAMDLDDVQQRMGQSIDGATFYQLMADCGLNYGPMFQVISEIQTGDGECLARLELPEPLQSDLANYVLHPSVMDGCLQSIAGVVFDPQAERISDLVLPTHAEQVSARRQIAAGNLWIHTRLKSSQAETDTIQADIDLIDDQGEMVAQIIGARVQRVSKQRPAHHKKEEDLLYEFGWQSQPLETGMTDRHRRRWLLLADPSGLAAEIAQQLSDLGDDVTTVQQGFGFGVLGTNDSAGYASYQLNPLRRSDYRQLIQDLADRSEDDITVVDFWGIVPTDPAAEGELAKGICSHSLLMLQVLAPSSQLKVTATVLVTQGANAVVDGDAVSPAQTSLWGLGRTAMVEMPHLSCRLVDLDPANSPSASAGLLLEELIHVDAGDAAEDHVAFRAGERYVARLNAVPGRFRHDQHESRKRIPRGGRFSLRLGTTNTLDGLHYVAIDQRPLKPEEVEIEVKSTGLNFSDVLKGLGLYPGLQDEIVPLGIECAGVVSRVGDAAKRFRVGQRVMGVAPYSFASHTTTAEYAIVATPENITDDQAATIPITFLTAHHGLCRLGRLSKGDKVLIHAGAGGVGQAAIQIAQAIGAEVFATAGSEEKRAFLRSLGVPHVMDSRTLDFADEIIDITSGYGVDVVLNSLPGEAITKSLSILSAYGRFLEIGKTDIYQNRRIGLLPFQDNLAYFAIDLDRMLRQRPDEIRQMYCELMPLFEKGTYRPLPLKSFAAEEVVDAYRYMAQRKNIGKVVVSMAPKETESDTSDSAFGAGGTVLVTGGLGALGRQVTDWLVEQGAKYIAILTRRDPSGVQDAVGELQASDVSLAILQGDVSDEHSLTAALQSLPESHPPIRGVIHAAGVLHDGLMQSMDLDQLDAAMSPKTTGAWNLHRALSEPLDFFVMFSSVAGTIGSPGQANYSAGNAFLDGLANHRRSQGLPATSIAWGPWDAEGMAADPEIRRQLSERGMSPLVPDTAIHLLELAIGEQAGNLAIMDVGWDALLAKLPGRGSSVLRAFRAEEASTADQQGKGSRDEELCRRLQAANAEERLAILQNVIASALGNVMGVDAESIEWDQPLATLGLDSLMGMELRSSLESRLGVEIPMASLFDEPTVTSLAMVAAEAFAGQTGGADPARSNNGRAGAVLDKAKSNLVALGGSEGDQPPIFCIHPVGGDLRCYDGFAKAMDGRWVYGLRAQGLQNGSQPHHSMDAMISDYISTIRDAQPRGPYCLMGWSTGGIFAYEIARRLHEQNLPIGGIVMVDTPLPGVFENVDLQDDAKFLVDLVEFTNYFAGTSMEIAYQELHDKSEEEAISTVLSLAIEHGVLPGQTTKEYLHRLINVCKQHVEILQAYQPSRSDLPIQILRPEDTSMLTEATGQTHDEDLGWGQFVSAGTHEVPGHHFTMMTGKNAVSIAEKIAQLLRDSELAELAPSSIESPSQTSVNR